MDRKPRPAAAGDRAAAPAKRLARVGDLPDLVLREFGLRYEPITLRRWPIPYRLIGRERVYEVADVLDYVRARVEAARLRRAPAIHKHDRRVLAALAAQE